MTPWTLNARGRALLLLPGTRDEFDREPLVWLHFHGFIAETLPGYIDLTAKGMRFKLHLITMIERGEARVTE